MRWRCVGMRKQLALLVGDDLPERNKRLVELHLSGCPDCQGYLASLRRARAAMLVCEEATGITRSLWPALERRLEGAAAAPSVRAAWAPYATLVAAAAVLALLVWNRPSLSRQPHVGATPLYASWLDGDDWLTEYGAAPDRSSFLDFDAGRRGRAQIPIRAEPVRDSSHERARFHLEQAAPFGHSAQDFSL